MTTKNIKLNLSSSDITFLVLACWDGYELQTSVGNLAIADKYLELKNKLKSQTRKSISWLDNGEQNE